MFENLEDIILYCVSSQCRLMVIGDGFVLNSTMNNIGHLSFSNEIQVFNDGEILLVLEPQPIRTGCSLSSLPTSQNISIIIDTIRPSAAYSIIEYPSIENPHFTVLVTFTEKIRELKEKEIFMENVELKSVSGDLFTLYRLSI